MFFLYFCQLQEFVVQGLHKARVTCSNWSLNGMKLFTGDDQGLVVCTEFDAFQVINIKRVYSVYCGIIILDCKCTPYRSTTSTNKHVLD